MKDSLPDLSAAERARTAHPLHLGSSQGLPGLVLLRVGGLERPALGTVVRAAKASTGGSCVLNPLVTSRVVVEFLDTVRVSGLIMPS